MNYWLFKTEPTTYSIDHLAAEPDQTTLWEGVRNYQARNFLRDNVKVGDKVLFYHSNTEPPGVVGECRVTRAAYPDPTALDPDSKYFDPKSSPDNTRWFVVDVKLVKRYKKIVPLEELRETPGLEEMVVARRGNRLSITPVTADEWKIVQRLAKK